VGALLKMKYYRNPQTKIVFGYSDDQQDLIDDAVKQGWEDLTGSWPPPPDTTELLIACTYYATKLLAETDWATLSDVSATTSTPYLMNYPDFLAFRNTVRTLAINPVVNPTFPATPKAQWSTT